MNAAEEPALLVVAARAGATCRAAVVGELDITAANVLGPPLDRLTAAHVSTDLDLSGVSFVDVLGIRFLMDAVARAWSCGHVLHLVRPSRAVRRVFGLLDLDDALDAPPAGGGHR
jgi:anti-anti-sigma factor